MVPIDTGDHLQDGSRPSDPVDRSPQRRALDELARRIADDRAPEGGSGEAWGRSGWRGVRWRHRVAGVLLVAVVPAAIWLWPHLRRPLPADESLPRADATTSSVPPSGSAGPASTGSGPTGPDRDDVVTDPGGTGAGSGDQVVVHVVGGVVRPGVLRLPEGSRAVDAVELAGGLAPGADSARVNLAAELVDGQRLVVPLIGQEPPVEVPSGGRSAGSARPAGGSTAGPVAPSAPIDVNTASVEQLDGLPGVGPSTAAAIVEHRSTVGPFRSVEDLLDVRGIGEARLDALRDLVTTG